MHNKGKEEIHRTNCRMTMKEKQKVHVSITIINYVYDLGTQRQQKKNIKKREAIAFFFSEIFK